MLKSKILKREQLRPRVGVVVGTRPGIIKFAPVIRALQDNNVPFDLVHTGQHYSPNMDRDFFDVLGLPQPQYTNDRTCTFSTHAGQTAAMMVGVEEAVMDSRPSAFIVGGDANTNFAAAVAVRKLVAVELAHMEAGLRSGDWRMPEEHNRVMIDHISDVLFAPTDMCMETLRIERVKGEVSLTGNTIVDAVHQNIELARERSTVLNDLGLERDGFALLTMHREENVDHPHTVKRIIELLRSVASERRVRLVFPMHPRTKKRLEEFGLVDAMSAVENLHIIDPVDYLDMLQLLDAADFILTDSGGLQEEACVLKTPCLTLRENTERPETVDVGSNHIVGSSAEKVFAAFAHFDSMDEYTWASPYGDGRAGQRIAERLAKSADLIV